MSVRALRTRRLTLVASFVLLAGLTGLVIAGQAGAGLGGENCHSLLVTIHGTPGDDNLHGTPGGDVIEAYRGDDTVHSGPGRDVICGGPGSDELYGGGGGDTLRGGRTGDSLFAGAGNDQSEGGRGADEITDDIGRDFVAGGPNNDDVDVVDQAAKRRGPIVDDTVNCEQGEADSVLADLDDVVKNCEIDG